MFVPNDCLTTIVCFFTGYSLLRSPVVMEKLGSGQNSSPDDGFRSGYHIRSRKTFKKETLTRLPLWQFEKSQLLGLPILLL